MKHLICLLSTFFSLQFAYAARVCITDFRAISDSSTIKTSAIQQAIEDLGEGLTDETIKVHGLKTYQFNDLTPEDGFHGVGGHAGYSETTWLLAFRPELVDLTTQKSGKLSVRLTGILHDKPVIEEEWNPRNVSIAVANKLNVRVSDNFATYIKEL